MLLRFSLPVKRQMSEILPMETVSRTNPQMLARHRRNMMVVGLVLTALVASLWTWRNHGASTEAKSKPTEVTTVVVAVVTQSDVPVKLAASGTVSAQQTVVVRPQLSAVIKAVHIKEGQFVQKGETLFSLDARTEDANVSKTEGQLAKSRADLRNAERNLERQRELYRQNFISQAALDVAENQADALRGQLVVDQATVQANLVARGFSVINAPIAGRTGAISVYQGSLVQPTDALLSITQIDPINVSFTLPEREFVPLQQARAKGEVSVIVQLGAAGRQTRAGQLTFVDNAVDTASGTIGLKAEFPNADKHLWPGMFVTVTLSPSTLVDALTVPVQAVQNGPEGKFLYLVDGNNKVSSVPVNVNLVQDGLAAIEGEAITAGMRIVVEGAQNLRPGSIVTEAKVNGPSMEPDRQAR